MNKAVKESLRMRLMASPDGFSSKDLRRAKKDHRNGLLRRTQPTTKKSKRQQRLSVLNHEKKSGFPRFSFIVFPPQGKVFKSRAPFLCVALKKPSTDK